MEIWNLTEGDLFSIPGLPDTTYMLTHKCVTDFGDRYVYANRIGGPSGFPQDDATSLQQGDPPSHIREFWWSEKVILLSSPMDYNKDTWKQEGF